MENTLVFTRKHDGEEYKFYSHTPSYDGETGILNMPIEPYVTVETPENCFGYSDTVLLGEVLKYDENGNMDGYVKKAHTSERYLPKWILKKLEKQMIALEEKIRCDYERERGFKRQAKLSFYED